MLVDLNGVQSTMYLNPVDNILHADTWSVKCDTAKQIVLTLGGDLFSYDHETGGIERMKKYSNLTYPHIRYQAITPQLPEQIFSNVHLLKWDSVAPHSMLQDLLSTLSRQQQVLKSMGINTHPDYTLQEAARESSENLFNKGLFSFLFGNHVGSPFEIWVLACNIVVTLAVVLILIRCIARRTACSQRLAIRVPSIGDVAVIEEDSGSDVEDQTPEQTVEDTTSSDSAAVVNTPENDEQAPPYRYIYPDLSRLKPRVTFEDEPAAVTVRPSGSSRPPTVRPYRPSDAQ